MIKKLHLKSLLLIAALLVGSSSAWADTTPTTIYLETFGSTSSTSAYGSYSGYSATASMFTTSGNVNTHYSGDGSIGKNDLAAANLSSGYTGASGNSGCYQQGVKDAEKTIIQISNINISGYQNLSLSFGALGGNTEHKVNVSYKIDNGSETSLISNGSITNANWTLLSANITGTGQSLTLYFKHTPSKGWLIRMDDIKVTGVASAPSSGVSFGTKTPEISYPTTKTYSQVPSTASGYNGAITYSITANTAGATINSSTGLVTVTKGGSVTVKAVAEAVSGSFTSSEDTYTLTVNDTRAESGLAWSAASANVQYGANNNVFPTLTNPHSVSVTYSSTNTNAATIDGSGVITLKDITATTQISATFAGTDDYKDTKVSYTLNVTKGAFSVRDGVFDFVEAAQQDPIEDYGSGMTLSSSYTTTSKTWTAGNVTMVTSKDSGNGYRWWADDGTLRFYDGAKATFSVPNGYVITKIVTTGANFNGATPSGLSNGTWTGASNSVELTVNNTRSIKTITVTYTTATQSATVQTYGWATYIPQFNLQFAENTAYVVTEASVANGLTLAAVTTVPAGTPLLLKGAGEKTATVVATATAPTTNLLSVCNGTIADGNYAYVLAKDGTSACFKQWTGEASVLSGRVVLLLNEQVSTRSTYELDDEMTGITGVNLNENQNENRYYDLQGRHVAQPTKGLYIVNGKKIVVK